MDYTKMPYWHIILLVCTFYGIFAIQPQWYWYAVWFCMHFIIVTFGIHFTFHRLISHKAFRTSTFVERLGTIVGCLAMSGSSIGWAGVHIHHHRYSWMDSRYSYGFFLELYLLVSPALLFVSYKK